MALVNPASLLGIPPEIRLQIYSYLLDDNGNNVFHIRSEDPKTFKHRGPLERTSYRILGGILYRQSQLTTYHLFSPANLHTNILGVNRLISDEASQLIYGKHVFDFGDNIEAIVPFLSDLRTSTQNLLKEIGVTKKSPVFSRDFDRCEWHNACTFINQNLQLQKISLRVIGRRPHSGWEGMMEYTVTDIKTLARAEFEGVEWIREFAQIRTLKELDIIPQIEHCPPPKSTAMLFFTALSASIETGLTDYLRAEMLPNC